MSKRLDLVLRAAAALLALATVTCAPAAWAQDRRKPVAIALEVVGKAETQVGGGPAPVSVAAEFAKGDRVRVARGARLTVLFYASGIPYAIEGPALTRFGEAAPEALSGNEPAARPPLSGKDGKPMRIQPGNVTEAATVLRGLHKPIPALTLGSGVTLDTRPTFRWREVEPDLEYQFTLKDTADQVILSRSVRAGALEPPADLLLTDGHRYRWTVSTRSAAGVGYSSTYRFSVADRGRREQVENFRPSDDAPVAEQVAYAIWLAQSGFADEAARLRARLSARGIVWAGAATHDER